MNEQPIRRIHVWQVFNWRDRCWVEAETVRTWTRNHSLACRKAREGTPAYNRGVRFRVLHLRTEDPPEGMILVDRNPSGVSWKVEDRYGEARALARENARDRRL